MKTNIDSQDIVNNKFIKKIDLDGGGDKNNIIKTIKNIMNQNSNNSSRRNVNTNENYEKNKEDKNKNDNIELTTQKNNNEKSNYINSNEIIINNHIKQDNEDKKKNEDDPLIDFMNSQIKINDNEIKNSSKLILEEINCNLFNGKRIEINASGMINGRNKKDGFSIFGQKKLNDSKNSSEVNEYSKINPKNDNYFIPDYELNYSKFLAYPYIFAIYFKKEENKYYIKAFSGKGSDNKVLFIKLNNKKKFILNQKELIFTGNKIFQITPINDNCIEIINLSKKNNINNSNKYIFDGFNKKIITIGRHKDCDFSFPKDKSFSRIQTTIEFDEETKKWSIIDGNKDKGSTNGTWIFGTHSFLINNGTIVEILNCQIRITEIENPNLNNI